MSALLRIQLLGSFAVLFNDQPIHAFRSVKSRALLSYLATQPDQDHPRTVLAALFWGDLPDEAARTNLRIELSNLKKLLGDHPALVITRNTARIDSLLATVDAVNFHLNVDAFLSLPVEMQTNQLHRLVAAVDGYHGEFLAGFHLIDAPEFEDWLRTTRERLHEQMMLALETLQVCYAGLGQWTHLAAVARRQIALLPWCETAHRFLIQALAAQGEFQDALAQYSRCKEILGRELGVEPAPATQELVARLHTGSTPPQARHNLPSQTKSFVGRSEEIERLCRLVQQERLVTLLGIGGAGKSRLAQAVAQEVLSQFAHGVWFVPLANLAAEETAPQQIALAMAATIGFQVTNLQSPLDDLVQHLAGKEMLLILDNWDHLTAAADALLSPLLDSTPVHVLATSRSRLMLENEIHVRLDGLPSADAFALFVERARRVVPDFGVVTEIEDPSGIFRICEQVGGLPLGIELAAGWVEHFSVEEIRQAVSRIEIEPRQMESHLPRHHTLRNVFEYSWRLLSPTQQQILARLSVFRCGFDRQAAAEVAESTLSDLSLLIAHSLVQRVTAGRYDLHPLIQEFAAEKLTAPEEAALYSRHSRHYLASLAATARGEQRIEMENLRTAWQRAAQTGAAQIINEAMLPFAGFMAQHGLMADGEALFQAAVVTFEQRSDQAELVANLIDQQSTFTQSISGHEVLIPLKQRILGLTANPALRCKAHTDLAYYHAEAGEWEASDRHFDQAEALTEEAEDLRLYISAVESRIHTNALHFRGDFAQNIGRLQQMLALLDSLPSSSASNEIPTAEGSGGVSNEASDLRLKLLQSLGIASLRYHDYALAIHYYRENLSWITLLAHQQRRTGALLNLALAELYAGLNESATAHSQEALTLAEEIGAVFYTGLLKLNLGLTLRFAGRLEESLSYALAGSDILKKLKMSRLEAQGRNRIGHTLLAMRCWPDAEMAYGQALVTWGQIQHPYRYEAVAGRAVAAMHLHREAEALAGVEETLSFVESQGLQRITEPVNLLLNCEEVLRGVGQMERAQQVLQQADEWIRLVAARISDESIRCAFLARPDNQELGRRLALVEDRMKSFVENRRLGD
jgi:predicted ATPase/DNA-binding SARP family transcriptional activator